MASKKNNHANEEPVGWVTVKGVHFPTWADGTIGWDQEHANVNDKGTMSTEELNKAELRRDELWDKEDKHTITKAEKKELDDLQRSISEHYAAKRKYESKKVKEVSKEVKSRHYAQKKNQTSRDDQVAEEGSYTVSINRGVHGTERKTFKSAAEADKYVSDRVKAGDGSGSDYSIKYAASTPTTSRNAKYDTSRATLTSKSSSQLKTMYKNASPEEQKKIASEMAVRGFYRKDGKWYSRGGGR